MNFEKLQFNCPQCQKLYESNQADLKEGKPRFCCTQCESIFCFDWPLAPEVNFVKTELIEAKQSNLSAKKAETLVVKKECPRCFLMNPINYTDCPRCGVVIAKAKKIRVSYADKISQKMVEHWDMVVKNYQDPLVHEAFIEVCKNEGNLVFCSDRYGEILKLISHDNTAEKMQQRILEESTRSAESENVRKIPKYDLNVVIAGVATLFLLAGIILPHFRGLIAIGASMLAFIGSLRFFKSWA